MGVFDIFRKSKMPYRDKSLNLIYELLFCDNIDLFKGSTQQDGKYPFDILLSDNISEEDINKVIKDDQIESRIKILAYNKLILMGNPINKKELFAVIVEIGLDNGLDVLAAYKDGSARYINHSEKLIVWDTVDNISDKLINELFINSERVVRKIGPWDKPRRPFPKKGIVRITFLVSDGLYFGEGPIGVLFNSALDGPALKAATQFMKYLVEFKK
jgi:hypothetical protein